MSGTEEGARPATSAVAPSWVAGEMATLAQSLRCGRLPHALLIHEAPGGGGDWLASWVAQLVLCQARERQPCGVCVACRRVAALQHPDLTLLRTSEESRQIRIEQVRELTAELALTSHAGGYKVALITPADALNRFAANALLKTLEEPPARTLLMLVSTQPSRLPPTVLSRCQRLRLRAPTRTESLAWLTTARGPADWDAALAVLGEAPMLAAALEPKDVAEVGAEARRTLDGLVEGSADPVAAAERWARTELALRLRCFENWLTDHIRARERSGTFLTEVRPGPYLSGAQTFLNIRELFGLVDEVRELRATLDVPLNRGLALEALFRRLAPATAAP
jgi:DNA polymerase-3 subunit delta'